MLPGFLQLHSRTFPVVVDEDHAGNPTTSSATHTGLSSSQRPVHQVAKPRRQRLAPMWALQPRLGARGGRPRSECGAGGRPRPPTAQRIGRQDALSAELPARVRPWSETLRTRWDEEADHPFVHALTRHYAARVRIRRPGGDRRDHDGGADRDKKNPPKSAHHLPAKLATPPRHNGFSTGYLPPWNIARQGRPIPNRGALAPLRSLAGEHGANRHVRVIHQSAPATAPARQSWLPVCRAFTHAMELVAIHASASASVAKPSTCAVLPLSHVTRRYQPALCLSGQDLK
jgi:hypothetical protein